MCVCVCVGGEGLRLEHLGMKIVRGYYLIVEAVGCWC